MYIIPDVCAYVLFFVLNYTRIIKLCLCSYLSVEIPVEHENFERMRIEIHKNGRVISVSIRKSGDSMEWVKIIKLFWISAGLVCS